MPSASGSATIPFGVIGGSGLYSLFGADADERTVPTPWGSARISIGTLEGRPTAFLTRHGAGHALPPHRIDYRSNIWALASLGVRTIVSSSAVGGLHADYPPGALVLTDQLIDRTTGRAGTFFDGEAGGVQHLAAADPFDPDSHAAALYALEAAGETVIPSGTVVVIPGPRFSTRAESLAYRAMGAHTINMTMAPEVPLAGELGLRTVNLSFVTDTDAGLADRSDRADTADAARVLQRLADAQPRIVAAIETVIRALPSEPGPLENGIAPEAITAVLASPALRIAPGASGTTA